MTRDRWKGWLISTAFLVWAGTVMLLYGVQFGTRVQQLWRLIGLG